MPNMRMSNKKEIGTDLYMRSEANNLIDINNNSTSNYNNHSQVPILIKKTTIKTPQFTHPQEEKELSTTSKVIQKIRPAIETKLEKLIDYCTSFFYNLLDRLKKKHIIENKIPGQRQSSEEQLQHCINMQINYDYLDKAIDLNYKLLPIQPVRSLLNLKAISPTRSQAPKFLPTIKPSLITYIFTNGTSKCETSIGSEAARVVYFPRNLI